MTNATLADQSDDLRVPQWTFADKLRKARQTLKIQQREMAKLIGSSPYAYAQWEAGNSTPRDIVPIALRIEEVSRVPAWWLLGMPEPGKPSPARGGGSATPGPVYLLPHLDSNQEPIDSQPPRRLAPVISARFGGPLRGDITPRSIIPITDRRLRRPVTPAAANR